MNATSARPAVTQAGPTRFRPLRSRANLSAWTLSAPAILFIAVLFVYPLLDVIVISFTDPTLSLANYREFFSSPLYSRVLGNTFWFALLVTVICLALGYPLAYVIVRYGGTLGFVLLLVVAMSFWTSFLVRTYSWLVILGNKGPATKLLAWMGVRPGAADPVQQLRHHPRHGAHPDSLYDHVHLRRHAKDRPQPPARGGEPGGHTVPGFPDGFFSPLSLPGVVNGCTLVFIICLGFYVTPVLLGGPRDQMIAGLIGQQIEELLEWGFASAMAAVLLATTMALLAIYNRLVGLDKLWG